MRVRRADDNQPEIVAALRKAGAVVTPIHTVGKGVSDLLVSFHQRWFVLEIKNSLRPKHRQVLTPDERRWIGEQKAPVHIVTNAVEAVGVIQMVAP